MELDTAEEHDTVAGQDVVDHYDTVEDIVAVDFHSMIGSCQHFVHIRNYWCFDVGNSLHHHDSVRLLDL